ncbi:Membrane protein involved in the export of O-antigen, teichoic acid lipoteichoic acid [Streptococcus sp. DD11]|uniref:hypothetical protein n=1 Tax=Streptococcus sp. DD11 TaxID=1777879 RepID=UPI000799FDA2|nr:hypothetical protein [Streptococcus sp. DD11]KXT85149.1 Membrane protein involved in the export of O-antigen, teichoic acid lipoteichoic acid [Streptococcus sp. DD11]
MSSGFKKLAANFSYVILSNLLTVLVTSLVVLILPKIMGVEEYGYWQLYIFYLSYAGFIHLGWTDGIYLRYGGMEYHDLDKTKFFSQFLILLSYLIGVGLLFLLGISAFITDANSRFVFTLLAYTMLVTNLRFFFVYVLQMTNRLKESSCVISGDRLLYLLLLLVFVFIGFRDFKIMVYADLIGRFVSLFYAMYLCRDMAFRPLRQFSFDFQETVSNIAVGINLMLSNVASMLIIGTVRMGIQRVWNIATFGKVSLTLSISNLLMTFINAIGLVVFPILKRTDESRLPKIYDQLRNILMIVMFGVLLLYYPLKIVLDHWLPAYKESLMFMALVFPMSVYEGKMALLINTYLKALRMERQIFKVNVTAMLLSFASTLVFAVFLHNLNATVLSIVLLLTVRSILAEVILAKRMQIAVVKDMGIELLMTFVFIASNWFLPVYLAAASYGLVYLAYSLYKYRSLKGLLRQLRAH